MRVNAARTKREDYLALAARSEIAATALPHCPEGVILAQALPVSRIPGFAEGLVSVQDGAAQLAAGLLAARRGERVLDALRAMTSPRALVIRDGTRRRIPGRRGWRHGR